MSLESRKGCNGDKQLLLGFSWPSAKTPLSQSDLVERVKSSSIQRGQFRDGKTWRQSALTTSVAGETAIIDKSKHPCGNALYIVEHKLFSE